MAAHSASLADMSGTQEVPTEISSRTPTFVEPQDPPRDDEDVNSEFEHEAYGPGPGEKPLDSYEVTMGPDDADNPKTWKHWYRWYITALSAILVLNACVHPSRSLFTGVTLTLRRSLAHSLYPHHLGL